MFLLEKEIVINWWDSPLLMTWRYYALEQCFPNTALVWNPFLLPPSWECPRSVVSLSLAPSLPLSVPGTHSPVASWFLQTRLEELHRLWELLLLRTREKGERLLQAQKLVLYLRECEDALDWISDKASVF